MTTNSESGKSNPAPWYEAYPQPSTKSPEQLSRDELLDWIHHGKQAGKDFLVVDVRKLDHTGGFLRGSLNLPIESLYPSLSTVYNLCKSTSVDTVIWYCVTSRGRGNRAAAWFSDFLKEKGETGMRSVALFEGILGWVLAGSEFTEHVDEYDPSVWKASDAAQHTGQLH